MNCSFVCAEHPDFIDLIPRYIEIDVSNFKFEGNQKEEFRLLYRSYCSYLNGCYFVLPSTFDAVYDEILRITKILPDGYKILIGAKNIDYMDWHLPQIYIYGRRLMGDFTMYEILKTYDDGDEDDKVIKYKVHKPYMVK